MQSLYDIAVRLSLQTIGFSSAVSMAMGAFQSLQQQAGLTSTAMGKLQQSFALFAGGAALTGAGVAGLGVLKGWISAAGQLQVAMAGVQLATVGTAKQLADIQGVTFTIAGKTMFSAPDIAKMAALAAQNGLNQRAVLLNALPTLANVAEVAYRTKGLPYERTTAAAVGLAHLFQSYPQTAAQTKSFNNLLDLSGRAQMVAGGSLDQLQRTLTYLAPLRSAFGASPTDLISLAAVASNVGLAAGRGGASRVMALFRQLAPTGTATHDRALEHLAQSGGGHLFQNGKFVGIPAALDLVMKAMEHIPNQAKRLTELRQVFGVGGMSAASLLASPGAIARFSQVERLLGPNGLLSTKQMQGVLNNTIQGQWANFQTNLQSINAILGSQLLPALAPVVHGLLDLSNGLMTLLKANPALARTLALVTALGTGAALVAGPLMILTGGVGLLAAVGLPALVAALVPVAVTAGAVVAAFAGATLIVANWTDLVHGSFHVFEQFGALGRFIDTYVQTSFTLLYNALRPVVSGMIVFGGWLGSFVQHLPTLPGMPHVSLPGGGSFNWGAAGRQELRQLFPELLPFIPGVGGGGRVAPPVTHHWNIQISGQDQATAEHIVERTVHRIGEIMGHDEYYHGVSGLSGSMTPGVNGY